MLDTGRIQLNSVDLRMIKNSFNDEVRATIEQNEHRHLSQRDYLNSS